MKNENKSTITNWEIFCNLLRQTKRQGIEELITYLDNSDFKVAPASTKFHGSYEGGLLEHSLNVYNECLKQHKLIELFNIQSDTLIITALLHDICKTNFYQMEMRNVKENGQWVQKEVYTVNDLFPIGHAEKSIIIAQQFIQLSDVEIAMIRGHMGGWVSDQYFNPSQLYDKYPEALILQIADMTATYVLESPGLLEEYRSNLNKYNNVV